MSDLIDIGRMARTLEVAPKFPAYSRVEIHGGRKEPYSAGEKTGRVLTIEDYPFYSSGMATFMKNTILGYQYQPYSATGAILDPAAELGDGIVVKDTIAGGIFSMTCHFGHLFTADISAPYEEELDHEYPYKPPQERKITRQYENLRAEFKVENDKISAEVVKKSSMTEDKSFGWDLSYESWVIKSKGNEVLKATESGLDITGKITATSGKIGGFDIEDNCLKYNGLKYRDGLDYDDDKVVNGSYFGTSGIQLGRKFQVSKSGKLIAKDGVFSGTITAKKGQIGAFEIGSNFIRTNSATWKDTKITSGIYIGSLGIKLGQNFSVTPEGKVHAKDGIFTGTVYASSIKAGTSSDGKINYGSIGWNVLSGGVQTSLDRADSAYNVLFNNAIANSIASNQVSTDQLLLEGLELYVHSAISYVDGGGKTHVIYPVCWRRGGSVS